MSVLAISKQTLKIEIGGSASSAQCIECGIYTGRMVIMEDKELLPLSITYITS